MSLDFNRWWELFVTNKKEETKETKLSLTKDGNQWCVLWGENLQEGIAGFGNTPEEAMNTFALTISMKSEKPIKYTEKISTVVLNDLKEMVKTDIENQEKEMEDLIKIDPDLRGDERLDYEYWQGAKTYAEKIKSILEREGKK